MIKDVESITVNRPASEVFDFLANPVNVPQWSAIVTDVEPLSQGKKLEAGTKLRANLRIMGIKMTAEAEVSEIDYRNRRAVLTSQLPEGGTVKTLLTVEGLTGVSIVTLEAQITPPDWLVNTGLSNGLMSRAIEAVTHTSLDNMRNILEGKEESKLTEALAFATRNLRTESI